MAAEFEALPDFSRDDRVLILAPHPDDETIGAGGVIQRALAAGAAVKVVLFTNGDNNELAFIVYEKWIPIKRKEILRLGEVRRQETIAAMKSLGLDQERLAFLGYPDFGTMEIFTKYWGEGGSYRSIMSRVKKVAYPEALSPGAAFKGENVLADLERIILDFQPTRIFVSHPADTNRDHRALYLFLRVALWDLEGQIRQPALFPYLIHVVGWPKPRGGHPELELDPPGGLGSKEIRWWKLELSEEEIKVKQDAVAFYKTQTEYEPSYLFTFVRRNELFGDFPALEIRPEAAREMNWQNPDMPAEMEELVPAVEKNRISSLQYADEGNDLVIRLILKRQIDRDFGIALFLLGYRRGTPFVEMPKLNLSVNAFGLQIKDKKQVLFVKDASLKNQGKLLTLRIPRNVLGNPDYVLSWVRTRYGTLPFDESAWRILEMK